MDDTKTFRVGFLASGLGAGALGFVRARASLGKSLRARFENVGGVDFDPAAFARASSCATPTAPRSPSCASRTTAAQ